MKRSLIRKEILALSPYVPGKPAEEVKKELGLRHVVKMASNENALGSSPKAVSAMAACLKEAYVYPDGNCTALKTALARKLKVQPENLCFGCGSDEIIHHCVLAFLKPGEEVITGTPSFVIYESNAKLLGGRVKLVPLKNFIFDLEGILRKITSKTKLIFIANPNNPTGTVVKEDQVRAFLREVPPDVIVVFDEAYAEYVEDKNFPETLRWLRSKTKNVLVLRTFSKIYGLAGLRIGYGLGREDLIAHLNRVREPFNVGSLSQAAALVALSDKNFVNASRKLIFSEKKFLYGRLRSMNIFFVPTQANFIFMDTGVDSKQLFQNMLRRGVIVRTGDIFGYPTFIRLTIGTRDQNQKFLKVFKKCVTKVKHGKKGSRDQGF